MVAGLMLRVFATGGELWLDEVWSLLKIADLTSPLEILTKVKHDNNHLLNSLWMWVWPPSNSSHLSGPLTPLQRAPSHPPHGKQTNRRERSLLYALADLGGFFLPIDSAGGRG